MTQHTFITYIKHNEYLNSVVSNYGLDIIEHAPKSGGANDYKDLATELISIKNSYTNKFQITSNRMESVYKINRT